MNPTLAFAIVAAIAGAGCGSTPMTSSRDDERAPFSLMRSEFIFESAPFPSCHASTIVHTDVGLVAAWFGGEAEGRPDVSIWTSRHDGRSWSEPVLVADGRQPDGSRHPCWNPVLFQPRDGPLLLFYKVGPRPNSWWGMLTTSINHGVDWSTPERLPEGQLGPVRCKPIELPDASILCGSSTEHDGWRVHMERTTDLGKTWDRSGPLNDAAEFGAIQPTILAWPDGRVQILNRSRQGWITECWMGADWKTWSPMRATALPNSSTGIDAVLLRDGRALLVYNHTPRGRTPLNLAVSRDGQAWEQVLVLEDEPGEYSYPAIIQAPDGLVHVTYTWKRQRIKHVVVRL
jgi:predicted neuraminidase